VSFRHIQLLPSNAVFMQVSRLSQGTALHLPSREMPPSAQGEKSRVQLAKSASLQLQSKNVTAMASHMSTTVLEPMTIAAAVL
jgi:hypothetical protein